MKKVTLLVSDRRTNIAVRALRKLGVMHIKHMRSPRADYITSIRNRLSRLDKALAIVADLEAKEKEPSKKKLSTLKEAVKARKLNETVAPWKEISNSAKEIVILNNKKQGLLNRLQELEKNRIWFKEWGDVSQGLLEGLKTKGIFIRLHVCSSSFLRSIAEDKLVYVVYRKRGTVYIVHIGRDKDDSLGLPEIEVPRESLHSIRRKVNTINARLPEIDKRLAELSVHKECFLHYKKELLKKLEFCEVRFGMAHEEGICCLGGFCPQEAIPQVKGVAAEEGWATIIEEPDKPEEVPILIRNPGWIEIIKPVFKFMETLPGYKEYDISFWFLLFFSLFFAMLIGDAGYGLLFLAATFFAQKKLKNVPCEPFFLMYVLSGATIIWGAITGTWFGAEGIAKLPFFNNLIIERLDTFITANQMFLIYLCFVIGAIHLSIAHGIVFFKKINSLAAIAHLGWICILWSLFFLIGKLFLDKPFPDFAKILFAAGISLVLLFSNPNKNIVKGIGVSLANLPLKLINSFGDILSYLRLFAVGYATVMVALSCNQIAEIIGFRNIFVGLAAAVVLFVGHAINIALGILSVLVHGVRLNMLEFSGHMDMEWSGRPYEPFKE